MSNTSQGLSSRYVFQHLPKPQQGADSERTYRKRKQILTEGAKLLGTPAPSSDLPCNLCGELPKLKLLFEAEACFYHRHHFSNMQTQAYKSLLRGCNVDVF